MLGIPSLPWFQKQVFLENPKRSKRVLKNQLVMQDMRGRFLEKTALRSNILAVPKNALGRDL